MDVLVNQSGVLTSLPNIPDITQTLKVGVSGDVDYTSIKSAVDAAVSGGASSSTWWLIDVAPGTYSEDPMTIPEGVIVSFVQGARSLGCFVNANNSAQDLFTVTGGTLAGFTIGGVTDSAKALIRCTSGLSVLWNISVRNCSTGVIVGSGATALGISFVCSITAAGQGVTVAAAKVESGGFLGINTGLGSVPSAVLASYAGNPVERMFICDGGRLTLIAYYTDIAPKNSSQAVIEVTNGGQVTALAGEWRNSQRAFLISAGGSGSKATVQGVLDDNTTNFQCDSASGLFFLNVSVDGVKQSIVAGAEATGMIQIREGADAGDTHLVGKTHIIFDTGREADMETSLYDFALSGVDSASGGAVTAATGLDVNVAAGAGWVYRDGSNNDTTDVSWTGTTKTLTASATNYVYYDVTTLAIANGTSAPAQGSILLAQVVTDGSGIRYIHDMRRTVLQPLNALNTYFLDVQEFALKSGLGVTEGSTARTMNVASGSYYRAMWPISYAGATPATFSYFYGSGASTEVPSQTQLSNTQYDNAGTLTAMTASYYRADTVILTSDGRVNVIYGTAEYSTQSAAEAATEATVPTFMAATGTYLAKVVCQQGATNIISITDLRPIRGVSAGGGGGTSDHSLLSNLGADDHTQYLLVSGSRAMGGNLDMGANAITNVGNVDGVDVSAHGARHNPGGTDAIATAVPVAVSVGATAAEGSAASLARSDHQHGVAAGVAPVNVTKATAAEGSSSSVARADHKHDVTTASAVAVGTTNAEGTSSSLARADHTHQVTGLSGNIDVPAAVQFSADISPASIGSNQNDYNPSGLSTASTLRLTASTNVDITGLAGGADGRLLLVQNVGFSFSITFKNENVGSSAANRFDLRQSADVILSPRGALLLQYDSTASRWRVVGVQDPYGTALNSICQGNDSRLSDDRTASGIRTATTVVAVSSAAAPTAGQVLTATSSTAANWQAAGGTPRDTTRFVINGKPSVTTGFDGAWIAPRAGTVTRVTLYRRTAGSSGSTTVDVNKNGTTIYPTTGKPTVTTGAGSNATDSPTPDVTSFAQNDRFEVDVDAVESGNPQDISVILEVQYT